MELLPLATAFLYGDALGLVVLIVLVIHGSINFGLVYIYHRFGLEYGACALTFSVLATSYFYWDSGFYSPMKFVRFVGYYPPGIIGLISPLSVLYMPLAILLRSRNKALKCNGAEELPKDKPK
ncbi:MAG: hypothetical protein L6R28_03065 [Planctomycetes bacterium]|nr:hypothetical protein [Planctomycetota bacterium]